MFENVKLVMSLSRCLISKGIVKSCKGREKLQKKHKNTNALKSMIIKLSLTALNSDAFDYRTFHLKRPPKYNCLHWRDQK